MQYQSLYLPLECGSQLHVMSINKDNTESNTHGIPVLMVHGMVEDGRIFYHRSGKGLGSYLAKQGYHVYAVDLRGLGKSTPAIHKNSQHGQTETICNDLPKLMDFVLQHSGHKKLHLMAHSWGGVYLNSMLGRLPELIPKVISGAYFGSKRRVRVKNLDRLIKIEVFWNRLGRIASRRTGYLPGIKMKMGSENETDKTHKQCVQWVKHDAWKDSDDGFDYAKAIQQTELPPILYYAAINDLSLGHRSDVKLFMNESGVNSACYQLLSKKAGHQLDYDHLNMLTAPECITDHFPQVLNWMLKHEI